MSQRHHHPCHFPSMVGFVRYGRDGQSLQPWEFIIQLPSFTAVKPGISSDHFEFQFTGQPQPAGEMESYLAKLSSSWSSDFWQDDHCHNRLIFIVFVIVIIWSSDFWRSISACPLWPANRQDTIAHNVKIRPPASFIYGVDDDDDDDDDNDDNDPACFLYIWGQ